MRLAEELCEASFAERVFFCNSGAEANEGRDQARAQACEPPPRPGEARDRDFSQRVPRPHPRHGDRHRAAEVPRGLRAVAGRLPVLRLQRCRGARRCDRGAHLRGAGGADPGRGGVVPAEAGFLTAVAERCRGPRRAADARRDPERARANRTAVRLPVGGGFGSGRGHPRESARRRAAHRRDAGRLPGGGDLPAGEPRLDLRGATRSPPRWRGWCCGGCAPRNCSPTSSARARDCAGVSLLYTTRSASSPRCAAGA